MAKNETVGSRIKEARDQKQMTQLDIAKILGISRAAIAQWENETTSPSISTVTEVAKLLETTPQWLAYGVSAEPTIVHQTPPGMVEIKEVAFGESPVATVDVRSWVLPLDYIKSEIHAGSADALIIWRVEGSNMTPSYELGDKVFVDTSSRKPSPSGVFLTWDGFGPALHNVTVTPSSGKLIARVSNTDGKTEPYEVPAEKLVIIGRVRGVLKNV